MNAIKIFKVVIPALLLAIASLSGCDKDTDTTTQTISATLIGKGVLSGAEGFTKQFSVIKTEEDWQNFKTQLNSVINVTDNFTENDIDFSAYQVIFVIDDINGSSGCSIDITDVTENADNIVVTVSNSNTGDVSNVISQPFEVVKIPVSDKQVIFEDNTQTVPFEISLPTEAVNPDSLIGKWKLFAYENLSSSTITTKPDSITASVKIEFLNFIEQGTFGDINFRGWSVANELEGEYNLTDYHIYFINLWTTTLIEPAWGLNFIDAMYDTDLVKIENDVLFLFYQQSQNVMLFHKIN